MKIRKFNENVNEERYIVLYTYEDGDIASSFIFENEEDFGNYILYNVNEHLLEIYNEDDEEKINETLEEYTGWILDQNNIPVFYEWEGAYDWRNEWEGGVGIMGYSDGCEIERNVKADDRLEILRAEKKYNI